MIRDMIVEDQKLVRSLLESYIQNEDGYQLAVSCLLYTSDAADE